MYYQSDSIQLKDIYKKHGISGFYIQTLFRLEPELYGMMERTIEMGRAFIIKEYQQKVQYILSLKTNLHFGMVLFIRVY